MSTADSARLRAPYGMRSAPRRPREFRAGYERRHAMSGSNAVPILFVGLLVLGLGAFVGYLVAENNRLQSQADTIAETLATKPSNKAVVTKPERSARPSDSRAKKETEVKVSATSSSQETNAARASDSKAKAQHPPGRRAAFLGLGISTTDDYVGGANGHWALAQDVWAVEVADIKQKTDGNWNITFSLLSVLKGAPREKGETITINSINPWREFKLPPGNDAKGLRFACFLTKDSSFFILSWAGFETVKASGL